MLEVSKAHFLAFGNIDDTNETVDEQYSYSDDISKENPTNPICTSTPVKKQNHLLKCEDCINVSQCKACRITQQIEDRHEIMHEGRKDMKSDTHEGIMTS